MGASFVRCGFEDSRLYNGKVAENNPELITALRDALESAVSCLRRPMRQEPFCWVEHQVLGAVEVALGGR